MKKRKTLSTFLVFSLIVLSVFGLMGASLGIKAINVKWDGKDILIDSTETADTSAVFHLAKADTVVAYMKVYDGADGNDTVVGIVYSVSPIDGALTALSEIDTFATDTEVRKVINTKAGYWGICVVVNRIGTGDAGDSVEVKLMPFDSQER